MLRLPTPTNRTVAAISYGSGSPFTYNASLAPGGGYQSNLKTTSALSLNTPYLLLFRGQGESGSVFHADAGVGFTVSK